MRESEHGSASRYLVVANPMARRQIEDIVRTLRDRAPSDSSLDIVFTKPEHMQPDALIERARQSRGVIAVGGDGTVAEAATAVEGHRIPLAIIPAGSTNVIARSFRIPRDPETAADLAFRQPAIRTIDVGLCNGRRFLHMGGAGFDSRMFEATSRELKKRLGWVAYLQGASRTILAPAAKFSIDVDGATVECASPLVLVANGSSIVTPAFRVYPGISYDDGALDVIILTGTRTTEIARMIGRFATRSLDRSPFALHLRGSSIRIRSDPPSPIQLDGDVFDHTPAHFSVLPKALDLVVPD